METTALILDLDNTLYCWIDAFAQGLEAQMTFIAQNTDLEKKKIQESFRNIFYKHGSVEIIDAVYELEIWDKSIIDKNYIENIKYQSNELFLNVFADNLKLFPSVKETLEWARQNNILLFAFSDARAFWINFRLGKLELVDFFERIYALEDETAERRHKSNYRKIISLPETKIKPNTFVIDEIVNIYHINKQNVYVVGDNKNKDIQVAHLAGVYGIWAQYGKRYSQKSKELLSSITPWTRTQNLGKQNIVPQYSIGEFSEIRSIINF